jgi:hypothetical protein
MRVCDTFMLATLLSEEKAGKHIDEVGDNCRYGFFLGFLLLILLFFSFLLLWLKAWRNAAPGWLGSDAGRLCGRT